MATTYQPTRQRVCAVYNPCSQTIDIYLRQWVGINDHAALGQPVVYETMEMDGRCRPPTLSMQTEAAQEFMDALWQCGLRPTEGRGSAGALAATEKHLKDMREIAFQKLALTVPDETR